MISNVLKCCQMKELIILSFKYFHQAPKDYRVYPIIGKN